MYSVHVQCTCKAYINTIINFVKLKLLALEKVLIVVGTLRVHERWQRFAVYV